MYRYMCASDSNEPSRVNIFIQTFRVTSDKPCNMSDWRMVTLFLWWREETLLDKYCMYDVFLNYWKLFKWKCQTENDKVKLYKTISYLSVANGQISSVKSNSLLGEVWWWFSFWRDLVVRDKVLNHGLIFTLYSPLSKQQHHAAACFN